RLNAGIFSLHLSLTALFVALPLQLVDMAGITADRHWQIYVPVLVLSVAGMVPLLVVAHRRHRYRETMAAAIVLMIAAELLFPAAGGSLAGLVVGLRLFFVGFNALEAMLPSLVSRLSPAGSRGTTLGVYNTFEFAGIFVGGFAGGMAYGAFGPAGAYLLAALVLVGLLVAVIGAPPPRLLDSFTLMCRNCRATAA